MRKVVLGVLIVVMVFVVGSTAVFAGGASESVQQKGAQEQENIMERARDLYPTPEVNNFLTRKAVVKWMGRMDTPSKTFYIYVMSDTGSIVHYFAAQYRPVSVNTYLTPTKRIEDWDQDEYVLPANALDGTYYGEGGASNQYFFFDAETDAYIELKGLNYIVSDQPLNVDVPRITIGENE